MTYAKDHIVNLGTISMGEVGIYAGRVVPVLESEVSEEDFQHISSHPVRKEIENVRDSDDGENVVPMFFIREITPNDDGTVTVKTTPSDGTESPAGEQVGELGGLPQFAPMHLKMNKGALLSLRAFSRATNASHLFIRRRKDETSDFGRLALVVSFPPDGATFAWRGLNDSLMNMSDGAFAAPDGDEESGLPEGVRDSQREVYRIIMSALTGDSTLATWQEWEKTEGKFRTASGGEILAQGMDFDSAVAMSRIIMSAYQFSLLSVAQDGEPYAMTPEDAARGGVNNEFAQIMSFNNLLGEDGESALEADMSFSAEEQHLDPFFSTIPLSVFPITEYLVQSGNESILDMLRWNFANENVREKGINDHGLFSVLSAMVLQVIGRIAVQTEDGSSEKFARIHALTITAVGFIDPSDTYCWEVGAYVPYLMERNPSGLERLAALTHRGQIVNSDGRSTQDMEIQPYGHIMLMTAITGFISRSWTREALFGSSPQLVGNPELSVVVNSIVQIIEESTEEDEAHLAREVFVELRREFTREAITKAIPGLLMTLVDVYMDSVSSPYRAQEIEEDYITELLGFIAQHCPRSLHAGDDEDEDDE